MVSNPSCACKTELTSADIDALENDNRLLQEKNQRLKEDVATVTITKQSLQDDNRKLNFYTGIGT